jgi:hypothetical protein
MTLPLEVCMCGADDDVIIHAIYNLDGHGKTQYSPLQPGMSFQAITARWPVSVSIVDADGGIWQSTFAPSLYALGGPWGDEIDRHPVVPRHLHG